MDAPTLQPKFLKNGSDLGIVAVGFSGGQVRDNVSNATASAASNNVESANPASMQRPWLSLSLASQTNLEMTSNTTSTSTARSTRTTSSCLLQTQITAA
jgi:hypothetical protein